MVVLVATLKVRFVNDMDSLIVNLYSKAGISDAP